MKYWNYFKIISK